MRCAISRVVGLGSVLHEIATASNVHVALDGKPLADEQVQGFCEILGLDPLYMGNEGKLAFTLPAEQAGVALAIIRASRYGKDARQVGTVLESERPLVTSRTRSGGNRTIEPLLGEGLPRIC